MKTTPHLTTFKLVMMALVAIDTIKNLPTNALYGPHLILYYGLAVLVFFIPSSLVSAELATSWPVTGGVYIWMREAFDKRIAFLTVWIQWLVAIIWYPSILSFIAATLAYLVSPDLATNKLYIVLSIQVLFWGAIILIGRGIRISSSISILCAIIGLIMPMFLFIILGLSWLYSGHPSQVNIVDVLNTENMINQDSLRLFITLLYSLMGIEIIAAHAGDVKNPQKDYPRALFIACGIILATVIPSSLAITIVVPHEHISLTTGVIEAFVIFLKAFDLEWMKPVLIISLAAGSFGIFLTWLLGSTRCLLLAAKDGSLPNFLQKTNQHGMPITQLCVQGSMFTLLSSAFILLPSVNSAFWFLSAASAQFALLYYLFLFAAAARLRSKFPHIHRPFKAGKTLFTFRIICAIGALTCCTVFLFGFIPPSDISPENVLLYEITLSGLIISGCGVGLLIHRLCQQEDNTVVDLLR